MPRAPYVVKLPSGHRRRRADFPLSNGWLRDNSPVTECDVENLPAAPGAYVLEFRLPASIELDVGRLGTVSLDAGRLRYYGSARGPGGLRARVRRHLEPEGRNDRWHIDVLTRMLPVARVWIDFDGGECELVARDLESGSWESAVEGFGCSDCRRCRSHLLASRE